MSSKHLENSFRTARPAADRLLVLLKTRGPQRVADLAAAAGHARFPDGHAELAAHLINSIRTQMGEKALDRLIELKSAESKTAYAAALQGAASLKKKVERLAEARTREGYMAESWAEGKDYILVENHCPICVAAAT